MFSRPSCQQMQITLELLFSSSQVRTATYTNIASESILSLLCRTTFEVRYNEQFLGFSNSCKTAVLLCFKITGDSYYFGLLMMVPFAATSLFHCIKSKFLVRDLIWSGSGLLFPYCIIFSAWQQQVRVFSLHNFSLAYLKFLSRVHFLEGCAYYENSHHNYCSLKISAA